MAISVKKFVVLIQVVNFLSWFFIILPHYSFNTSRICSDVTALISDSGYRTHPPSASMSRGVSILMILLKKQKIRIWCHWFLFLFCISLISTLISGISLFSLLALGFICSSACSLRWKLMSWIWDFSFFLIQLSKL